MEKHEQIRKELTAILGEDGVMTGEPMSKHTTFRIGGPADLFLMPHSAKEILAAVKLLKEEGIFFTVIGNGSNLLVSDEGIRGAVIRIGHEFSNIEVNGTYVSAEAGALLSSTAAAAAEAHLAGMEFAGGIPGSVGGACIMNAGAYGGEMKQILVSADVIDSEGSMRTIEAGEMELGYRTSAFSEKGMIVLSAVMHLKEGDPKEIRRLSEDMRIRRQSKQPLNMPSAGSTFKRPEGYFAGKLIMDAGLRGFRVGGAAVSEKHCGFVVNTGGATCEDVKNLISEIQRRVFDQFGVMLEPEVKFI